MVSIDNEMYKDFFDLNPIGLCVLDMKGKIQEANQILSSHLAYTKDELQGMSFFKLLHPTDIPYIQKNLSVLIANKTTNRARFRSANQAFIEMHWTICVNEQRKLLYVSLKPTNDNFAYSEEKSRIYTSIIENNWDAITFSDVSGNIMFANSAAIKLYNTGKTVDLEGVNLADFHSSSAIAEDIKTAIDNYGGWSGEVEQQRLDGSVFHAMLTITMIFDSSSHPIGLVSTTKDITDRKNTENELLQTKEDFATLLQKQNVVLEAKVKERTQEIRAQQEEIAIQRDTLEHQNTELREYRERIGRSIHAAKLIQKAILPTQEAMNANFEDHFVLYRPKDVVSGDFYWMHTFNDGKRVFIEADCTGHGVAGAFITFVGSAILDYIIRIKGKTSPALIMELTNKRFNSFFQQKMNNSQAGMDMSIVVLEEEGEQVKMTFGGAKQRLYHTKDGEIHVIKGSRKVIGGIYKEAYARRRFQDVEVELNKGEFIYLCSDGYIDQNIGSSRQKFGSKQFKALLTKINHLSAIEQKEQLEQAIELDSDALVQRDDITLIGLKV